MKSGSFGSGEGEQTVSQSENEEEIIKEAYLTDYENYHLYIKFK